MADVAKLRAARALARGATQAAAAREAGVDPASITRWKKTPEFQDLVLKASDPEPLPESPSEAAKQGLTARIEKALTVIDRGLDGDDSVSPQMMTAALNVIKAAKTYEPQASKEDQGPSTLASLIAEADAKQTAR